MIKILPIIVLLAVYLNGFSQMIYIEKEEITPDGITSFGGLAVYDHQLFLLLSANIRYDGKIIESSESKTISQKYRVWDIFRYDPVTGEMGNVNKKWKTPDAAPNGFCLVDDSTVVYTDNKSQLVSNNPRFNTILTKTNNVKYHFTDPCWDVSRNRLYFSSDYAGSKGGMDLWYIETAGDYAGIPVNAGVLNSQKNELSPTLLDDSLMIFVSNRNNQQYDIFVQTGEENKIINPEETPGCSEFFTVLSGKEELYFVSSTGKKQSLWKGKLRIRPVENIDKITPPVVEDIPIKKAEAEPEEIKPQEAIQDDPDFRLDNYFGIAKFALTPLMQDSLNKIALMLNENPTLNIVICGHSSPDGPEDKNMFLSSLRANEAYNWLLSKGIKAERIFRVYGGEYLYGNLLYSRMFSIFPVSESEMPDQTVIVPAGAIGDPAKVYPAFGIDKDEVDYWRYILKKQLPVSDQSMLLLPVKNLHYVKKGETLYSIAKWYGSTVENVIKANNLENATVPVGKIIYVPEK